MMPFRHFLLLFALSHCLGLASPGIAAEAPVAPAKLPYSRAVFDPKADADADLEHAKSLAAKENRRILIIAGGDWCPWCRALSQFIESNAAVSAILAKRYVIQKVCVSDEVSNTGFLNPLGPIKAYPHLFFLDRDGRLLHSQDMSVFEKPGVSHDEARLVGLLKKWSAPD